MDLGVIVMKGYSTHLQFPEAVLSHTQDTPIFLEVGVLTINKGYSHHILSPDNKALTYQGYQINNLMIIFLHVWYCNTSLSNCRWHINCENALKIPIQFLTLGTHKVDYFLYEYESKEFKIY